MTAISRIDRANEGLGPQPIPDRSTYILGTIKEAILSGVLKPGQSLVETELAGRFGVSKTPVREALKTLAGNGLVTMSPYKGAAVCTVDMEMARAVYEVRLYLEPQAVTKTVAGGVDLEVAATALDRAETAGRAERSLANRDFHRAMYAGCGNPLLVQILDDLRDQTALISSVVWARKQTWQAEATEHRAILAAAADGNSTTAGALTRAHIEGFATHLTAAEGGIA